MANMKQGNWLKISSPEDLQRALAKMLNKILMSEDPLLHAGRFASLANAWTNSYRLFLEQEEMNAIKERITAMEESQAVIKEQYSEVLKKGGVREKPE
ncbi:MAG: hypothetical protein KBB04_05250 [Methanothrix sp.]|jgi:hypothetical protein|uniref:hypothetical protein n=1 Tax=Methanothrix sp. TaxID=90426 RepID=UPI001B681316|nr:hypothetical protein [Methanothrix sp.]MBP7067668.1 hypothetical protein [Methanothrix sp.]